MSEQNHSNCKINVTNSQKTQIQELKDQYKKADALAKEVEDFVGEAGVPAKNELRYAGYHFINSLTIDAPKFSAGDITSAINHCKRACYEASEAGIVVALIKFSEFKNDYKHVVVSNVVADWVDIQKDFTYAQGSLNGRVIGAGDRATDHQSRIETFRKLRDHCNTLDCARDDLNAIRRDIIKSGQKFVITCLLTVLGIVVASLFAYLQLNANS